MNAPQPAPTTNDTPAVWPQVIADVRQRFGVYRDAGLLLRDMEDRDRIGRERYGTPLQAHNGRDAVTDAYQEALDLVVYLKQATVELPDDRTLDLRYREALAFALSLRRWLSAREAGR